MSDVIQTPQCGFMALVSYLPEPLSSVLYRLRASLPGIDNPQPHITVLPRRPVSETMEAASQRALSVLSSFDAFDVELSAVNHFAQTKVVFLDVTEGDRQLRDLHRALNGAELAHAEEFEYRPHLTLGGPVPPGNLEEVTTQVQRAWLGAGCSPRFRVDEIACLWLRPGSLPGEWERIWSHRLTTHSTIRAAFAGVTNRTY